MRVARHAIRARALGERPFRGPRNNAGRTRGGSHGNTRTGRSAIDGTRSRASIARRSSRIEGLRRGLPRLDHGRPYLSVSGFGIMERPRTPSVASKRPNGVAVRTHELTFRDL